MHGLVTRSSHHGVVVARDPLENVEAFPHRPLHSLARVPGIRAGGPLGRRPTTLALSVAARRHHVDVIHVHFGYVIGDVLGLARRRRLPIVLSVHGHDATATVLETPAYYGEVRDMVTRVIVPSRFLAERAMAAGFDDARIDVIPAGVDTRFFRATPIPAGAAPTAVFVGRLVEKKGVDVLLEAWSEVRRACPDAHLRVIGDGPLRDHVLAAGPGSGVAYEPPQPHRRAEQVRDAIAAAVVVVQPSRTAPDGDAESMLLVNLEAQASGRPVVSTRHGGIPEFVRDGETGLLVAEGDPHDLADAIATVMTDRGLAMRLGEAGSAWVKQFDVDDCTRRVDAIYTDVVNRERR